MTTLALFDLDHTLLRGDSDLLWCEFLVQHGLADAALLERNAALDAAYRSGQVAVAEFVGFHLALLAGRGADFWAPWCRRFLDEAVRPRIPEAARARVEQHRRAGHRLVLTTATNRVIAERTAADLGFADLIATEAEFIDGVCTGRLAGTPNMREGKVARLHGWLAAQGLPASALDSAHFYSDSINDLPLLSAVAHPVAVDPDARLAAVAAERGWPVLSFA